MRGYQVTFSKPFPGGSEVHRIRTYAEDLDRVLQAADIGEVPDMDSATDSITVLVAKTKDLGEALKALQLGLRTSRLETHATVARL